MNVPAAQPPRVALEWTRSRFEDLGVHRLYEALALRCKVFVLEQGAYLDPDGLDRHAWHVLGHRDGALVAYLRVVDAGAKYAEPSIGRVLTAPEVRGHGLGRQLMFEGLAQCASVWPGQPIRISAQAHLRGFYGSLGFEVIGDEYLEDNIPHLEMLWRPT
jgi:ElaA protein